MSRRDRDPNRISLLIRNLPLDCRADDVRYKFEKFGEIRDVYLPKDYYTGRARGFGFLEYKDPRDAEEAMYRMDRTNFMGREISVVMSKESRKTPRDMIQRERGPRGYDPPRDRSRDRRRSRSPRGRSRSPRGRSRSPYERRGGRGRSYSRSRSPPRRQDRGRSRSRSPARRDSPPPRPVEEAPRSPGYDRPDDRADPPRRSRSRSRSPLAAAAGSPRHGSPGYEEGQAGGYRDREGASPEASPRGDADSPRRRYDSQSPSR